MVSLIVTIVAIALVSALALATMYYGSSAYAHYQEEARITAYLNEAQQIQGAAALYKTDQGSPAVTLSDLVDNEYLRQAPSLDWALSNTFAVGQDQASVSDDVCLRFNQKQGINLVPSCKDPAYATRPVCCTVS